MKKLAYIIIILTGLCKYAHGQTNAGTNLFFVGYQVAIPSSNGDYLSATSWAGFNFDYRYTIKPNITVGIGTSFNSFSQYFPKQTYQKPDGSGAVTSDMVRHIYTAPITASIHYYLEGGMLKPYVGIGIGTEYSEQDAYFNIYQVYSKNWGFVVKPEVGVLGKFSRDMGGFISVAYNYATNSESDFNISHLSQIPITIGLFFTAR
ncbi:MAG TPA: outer membrane beta-barrel protein [Mucilaginibacter sp.]|jgi:opacity protein-like surface antigen